MKVVKRFVVAVLVSFGIIVPPAFAATTVTGYLGVYGTASQRFNFAGGSLQINVNSVGVQIYDPMTYLFRDDGSPDSALTGALIGVDDDGGVLTGSQLVLNNLNQAKYVLSIGSYFFAEFEARSEIDYIYPLHWLRV